MSFTFQRSQEGIHYCIVTRRLCLTVLYIQYYIWLFSLYTYNNFGRNTCGLITLKSDWHFDKYWQLAAVSSARGGSIRNPWIELSPMLFFFFLSRFYRNCFPLLCFTLYDTQSACASIFFPPFSRHPTPCVILSPGEYRGRIMQQ